MGPHLQLAEMPLKGKNKSEMYSMPLQKVNPYEPTGIVFSCKSEIRMQLKDTTQRMPQDAMDYQHENIQKETEKDTVLTVQKSKPKFFLPLFL